MQKVEINIPDGTKVYKVDILDGIAVVHYSEKKDGKFKKGDVVKWNGYSPFVGIIIRENRHDGRENYEIKNLIDANDRVSDSCYVKYVKLATPSEAQQLFDALAKQGKYWDAETLEVKDFVRVPESIGIYKVNIPNREVADGDGLYISFNEDCQLLGMDNKNYTVINPKMYHQKVQCYLQPIKRENLKKGDTAFLAHRCSDVLAISSLTCYQKILDPSKVVGIDGNNTDYYDELVDPPLDYHDWYKLIPIND